MKKRNLATASVVAVGTVVLALFTATPASAATFGCNTNYSLSKAKTSQSTSVSVGASGDCDHAQARITMLWASSFYTYYGASSPTSHVSSTNGTATEHAARGLKLYWRSWETF